MDRATLNLQGNEYVVLSRDEFDRLDGLAKAASLPPLPARLANGNYPAAAFLRASMARRLVVERARLRLTQKELADLAGVRLETICRLETGKNTASTATAGKIADALRKATKPDRRRTRRAVR